MTSSSTQFDVKITVVGTYNYHCSIHPTMMTGTITVTSDAGLSDINNSSFMVKVYPSPFSNYLSISFTMPERGAIKISIYDVTGKLVRILADQNFDRGNQIIKWDAKNENGETVNHGLYFYIIESKGLSKVSGKIIFGS